MINRYHLSMYLRFIRCISNKVIVEVKGEMLISILVNTTLEKDLSKRKLVNTTIIKMKIIN